MGRLKDHITISGRFARSSSLERDIDRTESLRGYVVTAKALEVVERIAAVGATRSGGGAWSITGPYGTGKSSLAVLLDGLFSEAGITRDNALGLVACASPSVASLVNGAHGRRETGASGWIRAVVTANREPISHTVVRALHSAVQRRFGRIPPTSVLSAARTLRSALDAAESEDPRRTGPATAAIIEVARSLAQHAPLLIVVDEFGKNLEAVGDSSDADPYLLQRLAEAGQGADASIFTLTLQHLSFEDYFADSEGPHRQEWAKVQGRFEDIPYVESPAQTRALIGTVFDVHETSLRMRIDRWAERQASACAELGITDLADPDLVASYYPLHPLAAAVLPELCTRYGQHERTLFSFLTGPDPSGVPSFLGTSEMRTHGPLPSVGLPEIYDYFIAGNSFAGGGGRWTEITTRLRDTHGLTLSESRMAKCIAVLNLVSVTGTLRASRRVLELTAPNNFAPALDSLQSQGIVTYREFADDHRIWQGSDVDLRSLLATASQRVRDRPLVDLLASVSEPTPVIAARHSAQTDTLRIFARRYVDGSETVEPLPPSSPFDGEVLLVVGADREHPRLRAISKHSKPVVAAIPDEQIRLDQAARRAAAIAIVLDDKAVSSDWVARREVNERLAQARSALDNAADGTFSPEHCNWVLLGEQVTELKGGRGSAPLSDAADRAYTAPPVVSNEMLNRTYVTSQGAKARRLLIEGMLEHGEEVDLGFEGYGPEVAMYRAFLAGTGLHRHDRRNDTMVFTRPHASGLVPAWDTLEAEFRRASIARVNLNDIYAALQLPPIGMKTAVIPVFVIAGLLAFNDEVAIYEHGTFRPVLTPDLAERLVRNPGHFDIKHFANTSGARRQVVNSLAAELGVRPRFRKHRVANVLAIVGHLVGKIARLDNYTCRTSRLSSETLAVRDALATAVEPDKLLFETLPVALGFNPIPTTTKTYRNARRLAAAVTCAMEELSVSYESLLDELLCELLEVMAEKNRLAISGQAEAIRDEVLNPRVRAFVFALANDSADTDWDWIQSIATVVSGKAPAEWTDDDRVRFDHRLSAAVGTFRRLVALHSAHRAYGSGAFDAMRVTFTRSDGTEDHRLIGLGDDERSAAERVLTAAIDDLAVTLQSAARAQDSLLALLGERILPQTVDDSGPDVIELTTRRATNA